MRKIEEIKTPQLTDVSFGSSLKDVVDNINANFEILGNHDFVKGDKGDSIIIQRIELSDPENTHILGGIKQAIINKAGEYSPKPINGIQWDKWFNGGDNNESYPGQLMLICQVVKKHEQETVIPIKSLPYIYKDLRFETVAQSDEQYSTEKDLSTVIYYSPVSGQEGKFDPENFQLLDVFPKIYYDESIGDVAWVVNNSRTGVRARGPMGPAGKSGEHNVVIVGNARDGNLYAITHVFANGRLREYENVDSLITLGINNDDTVFAIYNPFDSAGRELNKLYLGKIIFPATGSEDTQVCVHCSSENLVQAVNPIPEDDIKDICDEILNKTS